jgi:hypothetical protein
LERWQFRLGAIHCRRSHYGSAECAAAGATAGGVVGGLVGIGIPEYEAKAYEDRIKKGGYLVAVHVEDNKKSDLVREILKRNGLDDISPVSEK